MLNRFSKAHGTAAPKARYEEPGVLKAAIAPFFTCEFPASSEVVS